MIYSVTPGHVSVGGVGTYQYQLDRVFKHKITFVSSTESFSDLLTFAIPGLQRVPSIASIVKYAGFCTRLKRDDTVIYHATAGMLMLLIQKLIRPKIRSVLVVHGFASKYDKKLRLLEYMAVKLSNKIVSMNQSDFSDLLRFKSRRKISMIYNSSEFYKEGVASYSGNVISISRHEPQKDISYLLGDLMGSDVLQQLGKSFTVYGGGVGFSKNSLVVENDPRLANLRFVERESKERIFNNVFCFVLATKSEGFPISIIEAANCGIPIIVSRIPDLESILFDFVLYIDSANELHEILFSLHNEENWNYWSKKSFELADKYRFDEFSSRWKEVVYD
jgi:glycosyltransferase involved in cell wall biosynthesis